MIVDTKFCQEVIEEYSKRFTAEEIERGYKGMDIHSAKIAMDVFRIAFEKLEQEKHQG